MSSPRKSKRRTAYEVVSAILEYLKNAEESVKLNDIALAIGTNTNVVKRWLGIVRNIQNTGLLVFDGAESSKIKLKETSRTDIFSFTVITDKIDMMEEWIRNWEKKTKSLFDGTWKHKTGLDGTDLVISEIKNISDLTVGLVADKPTIALENITPELSRQEVFFFLLGWNYDFVPEHNHLLIDSLDIISLLGRNLVEDTVKFDISKLHQVLPIFVPQVGNIKLSDLQDESAHEELELYIQDVARISYYKMDTSTKFSDRSTFWANLDFEESERLKSTNFGRLFLAKISFCLFIRNEQPQYIVTEEIDEYHIWTVANRIERGVLNGEEHIVIKCRNYLMASNTPTLTVVSNFFSQEFSLEPRDVSGDLTPWYRVVSEITLPLNRINEEKISWIDVGFLLGLRNRLSQQEYPYIRIYILRKVTQKLSLPNTRLIYTYELLNELSYHKYVDTRIIHDSLHRLVEWTYKNGSLSDTRLLINYTNLHAPNQDYYLPVDNHLINLMNGNFEEIGRPEYYVVENFDKNYQYDLYLMIGNIIALSGIKNSSYSDRIKKVSFDHMYNKLFSTQDVSYFSNLISKIYNTLSSSKISTATDLELLLTSRFPELGLFESYTHSNLDDLIIRVKEDLKLNSWIKRIFNLRMTFHNAQSINYRSEIKYIIDHEGELLTDISPIISTLLIGTAYSVANVRGRSVIRDNLRQLRIKLSDTVSDADFSSNIAFPKLYLRYLDNLETQKTDLEIINECFEEIVIPDGSINVSFLLKFLLIRDWLRDQP
ncbi:MAG: hypothetical protein ACXAD7_18690 [Candidatus Kariarchaeaceae archaeon]|jgi:hypothetical protein